MHRCGPSLVVIRLRAAFACVFAAAADLGLLVSYWPLARGFLAEFAALSGPERAAGIVVRDAFFERSNGQLAEPGFECAEPERVSELQELEQRSSHAVEAYCLPNPRGSAAIKLRAAPHKRLRSNPL